MKQIIDSRPRNLAFTLRELFQYRYLFLILAYKDLRVKYAQTFLGLIWAFIQPLATVLIFTLVFSRALNISTEVPYPLYALVGLMAWSYFAAVVNTSSISLVGAQQMIKKIYFPKLIIPVAKSAVGIVDVLVTFVFAIILMLVFQVPFRLELIFLPLFILLNVLVSMSIGLWISALSIRFRDFQHTVPFLVQFGLYATPVAYPASLLTGMIPGDLAFLYYLNPMVAIIECYRWAFFGLTANWELIGMSMTLSLVLLLGGIAYFTRVERVIADII